MNGNPPTTSRSPQRGGDSYDNIEPWLDKLAALAPDDPHRGALREHIIGLCLPLAEHIARRFTGRGVDYDDLHQIASLGLVAAVDRFDPARGSSFLGFAVPTMMGEVRRHFRDQTWSVRVPRRTKEVHALVAPAVEELGQRLGRSPRPGEIAAELGIDQAEVAQALVAANCYRADSLDAGAEDGESAAAPISARLGADERCYGLLEDAMAVRPLLAALPERERQVLVWRFFDNLSQAAIAERLGHSQMYVSRMLARILDSLRRELAVTAEAD